jgi:hypothetical protein
MIVSKKRQLTTQLQTSKNIRLNGREGKRQPTALMDSNSGQKKTLKGHQQQTT